MATTLKLRRGTTTQHATFTGAEGEVTIDTTKDTLVVHDGTTAGGVPLAKESQATSSVAITGGTINGAAIGGSSAAAGAFTTLSASSTVSGTGFSTYLASPPSIGGTTAAAGKFTTLEATGVTTVSAGTNTAPAITTTGDTNTGIFFPAADTVAIAEGGVSLGNVNIWYRGLFRKANPTIVAWTKTGNFTVSTATTLYIEVNGTVKTIASSTAVTMPGSATTGTDYAIWAKTDGSLEATTDHVSPPTANARKVGGFHYAPGGNATGVSGGNTTAQINEYSFWDLKFRPACQDPRGMTLVANSFWADIYLCGVDHYTNGTSKYNVTIADGSSPPKVSAAFGGNGSTDYGTFTWFEANEVMIGAGKKLPTYTEAMTYAYGSTEASSGGTDPVSTILRQAYTSKWGVMLATGNMWQWMRDFIANGKDASDGAWQTGITETRGNILTYGASARAGRFGGNWGNGSDSGSRCSAWNNAPSVSNGGIGARGVCDHLLLD